MLPHLPDVPPVLLASVGIVTPILAAALLWTTGSRLAKAARGNLDGTLTFSAAAVATALSINGMWRVFSDQMSMNPLAAVALCAFLEIGMLACALRARRKVEKYGRVGLDGIAVWVIAVVSGSISAADADGLTRWVRLVAPVLAAFLWHRGMEPEREAAKVEPGDTSPIAWRFNLRRVAVWLRLADPETRTATQVDRHRRLARLTRACLRVAVLTDTATAISTMTGGVAATNRHDLTVVRDAVAADSSATDTAKRRRTWARVSVTAVFLAAVITGKPLRLAWARRRLLRLSLAAVEHLGLGADPELPAQIQRTVAAVVGMEAATHPANLTDLSPWRTATAATVDNTATATTTATSTSMSVRHRHAATDRAANATDSPSAIPRMAARRSVTGTVTASSRPAPGGDVVAVADRQAAAAAIERELTANPSLTNAQLANRTGVSLRTVERRAPAVRARLAAERRSGDDATGSER